MATPTEMATSYFQMGASRFQANVNRNGVSEADYANNMGQLDIAHGLIHLSTGIRATYVLLEEVKAMLQRQNQAPVGVPPNMRPR
jgi:hypothetical protein